MCRDSEKCREVNVQSQRKVLGGKCAGSAKNAREGEGEQDHRKMHGRGRGRRVSEEGCYKKKKRAVYAFVTQRAVIYIYESL